MAPTIGNGKICYLEIPAVDLSRSADFYRNVFGWNIRTRGDGSVSFDDTVNEVSGSFRLQRAPSTVVGLLVYVMVDSVAATLDLVTKNGGTLVQPIGGDPGGNHGPLQRPGRQRSRSVSGARLVTTSKI